MCNAFEDERRSVGFVGDGEERDGRCVLRRLVGGLRLGGRGELGVGVDELKLSADGVESGESVWATSAQREERASGGFELEQFDDAGGGGFEAGFAQKYLGVEAAGNFGDGACGAHVESFGAADFDALFEPFVWWFHAVVSFSVRLRFSAGYRGA